MTFFNLWSLFRFNNFTSEATLYFQMSVRLSLGLWRKYSVDIYYVGVSVMLLDTSISLRINVITRLLSKEEG